MTEGLIEAWKKRSVTDPDHWSTASEAEKEMAAAGRAWGAPAALAPAHTALSAPRMAVPAMLHMRPRPAPPAGHDRVRGCGWGHARRGARLVAAAWGDPVEWAACRVVASRPVCQGVSSLTIDLGDRASGFTKAGQYIQFRVGDAKPAFIALASSPGQPVEVLVKAQGGTAEALCALRPGDALECSPVMGKGFPFESAPPSEFPNLLIFVMGTGISPVRSAIESGAARVGERKAVKMYYGVRDADHDPVAKDGLVAKWQAMGVQVQVVYSKDEGRYVQDAFRDDPSKPDVGPGTAVVLVGQKEMATAVKAALEPMGVTRFLTNF